MQPDPISRSLIPQSTPQEDAYTQELRLRAIEKFRSEYGSNLTPQQVMQTVVWANDLNEQQLMSYLGPAAPDKSQFTPPETPATNGGGMPMPSFMAPPQIPAVQASQPQPKDHFAAFTGMFREDDPTKQAQAPIQPPAAGSPPSQQFAFTQIQSPIIQPNGQDFSPPEKVHDKSIHLFHGKSSASALQSDQAFESAAARLAQQQLNIFTEPPQDVNPTPLQATQNLPQAPQQPYLPTEATAPARQTDPFTFKIDHSHDKKKLARPKTHEQAVQVKMPDLPAVAMAAPVQPAKAPKQTSQPDVGFGGIDTAQKGQEAMATPIVVSAKDKTIVSQSGEVTLQINHEV